MKMACVSENGLESQICLTSNCLVKFGWLSIHALLSMVDSDYVGNRECLEEDVSVIQPGSHGEQLGHHLCH